MLSINKKNFFQEKGVQFEDHVGRHEHKFTREVYDEFMGTLTESLHKRLKGTVQEISIDVILCETNFSIQHVLVCLASEIFSAATIFEVYKWPRDNALDEFGNQKLKFLIERLSEKKIGNKVVPSMVSTPQLIHFG